MLRHRTSRGDSIRIVLAPVGVRMRGRGNGRGTIFFGDNGAFFFYRSDFRFRQPAG
jgi:hypothetical protein